VADERAGSELPSAARARMAEIRRSGTWGSALTTSEFAAIRGAGFEPVGQVLGAAVYNIGYSGGYACPSGGYGRMFGAVLGGPTQVSGRGGLGSYRPLTQAMYDARHKAISRMTAECAALGGHGVVGVRLTFGHFPLGGLEFKAIGTAVRGVGAQAPPSPFTSDLSGQDFAKLIMAGWVPVGLALGISIGARHDDWVTVSQRSWGAGNAEVTGYTELVIRTRHDAQKKLESDVTRLGAQGVVVATNTLGIRERECPAQEGRKDHIAEVTIIGTAIARFASGAAAAPPPVNATLSLDPSRRQAARVRLGR
jgi:uncharacterized protein YbjQ (UPF0145 family)